MAHVLSGTLAGLAFVLAFVLHSGLLFATAALLAVIAGVSQFLFWRKKNVDEMPRYNSSAPRDELADLGILEIRPKSKIGDPARGSGRGVLGEGETASTGRPAAAKSATAPRFYGPPDESVSKARPMAKKPDRESGGESGDEPGRESSNESSGDSGREPGRASGKQAVANVESETPSDAAATKPSARKEAEQKTPTAQQRAAMEESSGDGAMINGPDDIPLTVRPVVDQEYSVRFANPVLDSRVILPVLEALSAAIGSQTACIVERVDESLRYRVLAIASRSDYARAGGQYTAMLPYVPRNARPGSVHIRRHDKDLDSSQLRYYGEPTAIHSLAAVPLGRNAVNAHVLLVDSRRVDAFASKAIRAIITQFARTIDHVLAPPAGDDNDVMAAGVRAIEEEMTFARQNGTQLALALVHLNTSGVDGEASGYMSVENRLLEQLRDSDANIRIERLSSFTYGVFFPGSINEVEDWAVTFESQIESDPVIGHAGVAVGVAMLSGRHDTADEFRIDAMAALEEAFESGSCTILE